MQDGHYMISGPGLFPNIYVVNNGCFRPIGTLEREAKTIPNGQSLLEAVSCDWPHLPDTTVLERCFDPGQYHPRLYRPPYPWEPDRPHPLPQRPIDSPGWIPIDVDAFYGAIGQLGALMEQLSTIFRVVEPVTTNLCAFGHQMRNLLILACTEVEAQWHGVFVANKVEEPKGGWKTPDYINLLKPMHLDEYSVQFSMYPGLAPQQPFASWSSLKTTKTLDWYSSYNAVKHRRERAFPEGSLARCIAAVAACAIMVDAQFGPTEVWNETIGHHIRINRRPSWKSSEAYIGQGHFSPFAWTEVPCRFE